MLGAGDAFMSGFLRGWLRDLPLDGMLPARQRLRRLRRLAPRLRPGDPVLDRARGLPAHRQRASPAARGRQARAGPLGDQPQPRTGRRCWPSPSTTAPSSRRCATAAGTSPEHIPYFKRLALSAAMMTADGRSDGGILLDGRFGQDALDEATGKGLWIGRPVELPGSRPLRFEGGPDLGCTLARLARRALRQVPRLLPSRRPRGALRASRSGRC